MKKRSLSILLALVIVLILLPVTPALAAQKPDDDIKFEDDTVLTYNVTTPHDYLGDVSFNALNFRNGTPCNFDFSVFVVDDSLEQFKQTLYTSNRPVDFNMEDAIALTYIEDDVAYFSADIGGNYVDSQATKSNPNIRTIDKTSFEGSFGEPIGQYFYLYDENWNGTYWLCIGTIVFTQSEVVEFQKSGILPNNDLYKAMGDNQLRELLSKATVKVNETVKATGITLSKSKLSLVVGKSSTLAATVAPADTTTKAITWKSSNTKVATVDKNGKVTAVAAGTATITATTADGSNKAATSKLTVKKAVAVTGIANNKYYKADVTIKFTNATAKLDGKTVKSGVKVSTNGTHKFVYTDEKKVSKTITFYIDKKKPVITMKDSLNATLKSGATTTGQVTVTWTDNNYASITITCDGSNLMVTTDKVIVTNAGTYIMEATDDAGNVTTAQFTIKK